MAAMLTCGDFRNEKRVSPYTELPISIRIKVPTSAPSVLTTSMHSGKRWKVCWRFMSSTKPG
jgi:hypothetical protein